MLNQVKGGGELRIFMMLEIVVCFQFSYQVKFRLNIRTLLRRDKIHLTQIYRQL